jgi:hypothetical protein
MFTTGSKWFLGLAAVSFVLAVVYGYGTGGDQLGPFTAGYWGGVGDHLGYTILVSTGIASMFLGLVSLATRDASPSALAELAGTETAPAALVPRQLSFWPLVGAFGAAMVVLGLVISNVLFITGAIVLIAVVVEWMVLDWSERATGDPEANRLIRARVIAPFEVPIAGFLIVAGAVVAFSRVLLTASTLGAIVAGVVLAVLILGIGTLLATKPRLSANVVAGVLVLCGLGVVIAGVTGAARGERVVEHHDEEHAEEGETEIGPNIPAGTNVNIPEDTEEEAE